MGWRSATRARRSRASRASRSTWPPASGSASPGRTGAGKSTLALAAAGFIPRVVRARLDGRIEIGGVPTAGAAADTLLGRVGIVFATPANQLSASKQTVREELAFGLENLGVPRAEMDPRIDDTLARLGIAHLADREPFALSGGEQQRVAIASIVAMGTSVLVLDEPTAQLDPAGTTAVADLLEALARGGTAVLCAEHDPAVLGRMDRCLVLDRGRAIALGPAGHRPGPRRAISPGCRRRRSFDSPARQRSTSAQRLRRGRRGRGTARVGRGGRRGRATAGAAGPADAPPAAAVAATVGPGRRVGTGRRSGSRSTGSSIATRVASRPSAASRWRSSPGRRWPSWARTGRARRRWSSTSTASSDRTPGACCSTAPRPRIGPSPSSPGRSASSSRTQTTSCSSARSSARSRSARATWASRPATSRALVTRSLAAVGLAERAHDQPVRPRPVAAQARGAGRDPGHGPGRPRARRADDRPGRRRRRADRRDHRGLPGRRPLGRGGHPRHGVRRPALRPDRRHARRARSSPMAHPPRCSCRPMARCSPRPG